MRLSINQLEKSKNLLDTISKIVSEYSDIFCKKEIHVSPQKV